MKDANKPDLSIERWKDIPGYEGLYQASTEGRVRRLFKTRSPRLLKPHYHKRRTPIVKLSKDRRSVERTVSWAVAATWHGLRGGMIPIHNNGLHEDNTAANISVITRSDAGKRYGNTSKRRTVCKIDSSGEIIQVYPSARAAGRANHMSYQTILDRCNNKVKNPFALDGCNYQWDDRGEKY